MRFALILLFCSALSLTQSTGALSTTQSDGPEIRSINPKRAGAGQQVTIRGRNFSPVEAENAVFFGQQQVEVRKAKRKKLVLDLPDDLAAGEHLVTVMVSGQASNAVVFEFVPPVKPLQGDYKGETSQGKDFRFVVQSDREDVWRFRTSFTCTSASGCNATVLLESNRIVELDRGHFEMDLLTPTFSARITGLFLNESEAEGTAEFSVSGGCACETGKLKWSVKRDVVPPF